MSFSFFKHLLLLKGKLHEKIHPPTHPPVRRWRQACARAEECWSGNTKTESAGLPSSVWLSGIRLGDDSEWMDIFERVAVAEAAEAADGGDANRQSGDDAVRPCRV